MRRISQKYLDIYNTEMKRLNVDAPDFQPKATDYVKSMIEKINYLENKGFAYKKMVIFYFLFHLFLNTECYQKDKEKQIAGSRVAIENYKKNQKICLWKPSKESEPAWNSPWGKEDRMAYRMFCHGIRYFENTLRYSWRRLRFKISSS